MTQIELGQPVNIIGHLQINEWNGNQTPQMMIQDLATQNEQILDYRSKRKQLNIDTSSKMLLLSFILKREARENYFHYGETIDSSYNTIVFRDLPTDLDSVKQSLKHLEYSQLYLVLHHQHSIYFEGLPSSHLFKQSYKALFIRKEMNLEKKGYNYVNT